MSDYILGIDVSKAKFDVALLLEDGKVKTKKFANNSKGFVELVDWLNMKKINELHACMESTGNYGDALAIYLFNYRYTVSVVNPAQIKGFGRSELARTKTDKADAQLIALFCKAMRPKAWKPKADHIQILQGWVRRLEALQDLCQQEYNRLEVAPKHIKPSIEAIYRRLTEEIKMVKNNISQHIFQHADLYKKKKLLESIPGIGDATIAQVLAFIGNPEEFQTAKQLAAYIGLNPRQYLSGSSVKGHAHLSKMGDANLRKAFYMPAIVAKRYNPIINKFCQRLKENGKAPMVIIGAAMRKLIHLIYGVLKSEKPFDVSFA